MESDGAVTGADQSRQPAEVTVRDLAERITAPTGRQARIEYCPLPDDPRQRCPDITRARTLLGWKLDDGLRWAVAYFAVRPAG